MTTYFSANQQDPNAPIGSLPQGSGVGNISNVLSNPMQRLFPPGSTIPSMATGVVVAPKSTVPVAPTAPTIPGANTTLQIPQTPQTSQVPTSATIPDYTLHPGESIQAYNTRVAQYANPATKPPVPGSIGSIVAQTGYTPQEQAAIDAINSRNATLSSTPVDANQTYSDTLKQYQAQIDAINSIYSDQLNQSRIQNAPAYQAKLDQARLQQVAGGLALSPMAAAQSENIRTQNVQQQANQEAQINTQKATALNNIMTQVRSDANTAISEKNAAKKQGTADYLAYLNAAPQRRATALTNTVKTAINNGLDVTQMSPADMSTLSNELGVSKDAIISEYNSQKTSLETSNAKIAAEQAKSSAELAKTKADTAQIGKMTPYQSAQIAIEKYKLTNPSVSDVRTTALKSDIENAATQLQQIVQQKGFKGVNPDDYKAMADYLQKEYGISAVASLKTALGALGLKIDTGFDSSGNPIVY